MDKKLVAQELVKIAKSLISKLGDEVGMMMDYEEGTLPIRDTVKLFAELIRTGRVWHLQGFYGRAAKNLIEKGFISKDGEITEKGLKLR